MTLFKSLKSIARNNSGLQTKTINSKIKIKTLDSASASALDEKMFGSVFLFFKLIIHKIFSQTKKDNPFFNFHFKYIELCSIFQ